MALSTEAAAPATVYGGAGMTDQMHPVVQPPARVRSVTYVAIGDIVLVHLGNGVTRPLLVIGKDLHRAAPHADPEMRLNGVLYCEPDDHTLPAFRLLDASTDPARIYGRPDRVAPTAYGEMLGAGTGPGQWVTKPTNLPGKS